MPYVRLLLAVLIRLLSQTFQICQNDAKNTGKSFQLQDQSWCAHSRVITTCPLFHTVWSQTTICVPYNHIYHKQCVYICFSSLCMPFHITLAVRLTNRNVFFPESIFGARLIFETVYARFNFATQMFIVVFFAHMYFIVMRRTSIQLNKKVPVRRGYDVVLRCIRLNFNGIFVSSNILEILNKTYTTRRHANKYDFNET